MANPAHLELLQQGVGVWNEWRVKARKIVPDSRGADLRGADLRGADLQSANLQGADLQRATLRGAHLERAGLQDLQRASFREADLFLGQR
jgi:uncharacterized protein YjbI with pentapeptide repeats